MKFEWTQNVPWTQELHGSWTLRLMDKDRVIKRMGNLCDVNHHYVVVSAGTFETVGVLGKHLTLDEAKRAAKLLLCVGETA